MENTKEKVIADEVDYQAQSIGELAASYKISVKTMHKWLTPIKHVVGARVGRFYNPYQIKIIYEYLGYPFIALFGFLLPALGASGSNNSGNFHRESQLNEAATADQQGTGGPFGVSILFYLVASSFIGTFYTIKNIESIVRNLRFNPNPNVRANRMLIAIMIFQFLVVCAAHAAFGYYAGLLTLAYCPQCMEAIFFWDRFF